MPQNTKKKVEKLKEDRALQAFYQIQKIKKTPFSLVKINRRLSIQDS